VPVKTPRSQPRCRANPPDFIREVTRCAFRTPSERLRIEALTLLNGVSWPTASVMLHFLHSDPYPILDFRALSSLNNEVPQQYDFEFGRNTPAFVAALPNAAAFQCGRWIVLVAILQRKPERKDKQQQSCRVRLARGDSQEELNALKCLQAEIGAGFFFSAMPISPHNPVPVGSRS